GMSHGGPYGLQTKTSWRSRATRRLGWPQPEPGLFRLWPRSGSGQRVTQKVNRARQLENAPPSPSCSHCLASTDAPVLFFHPRPNTVSPKLGSPAVFVLQLPSSLASRTSGWE
uniref:Uncharacterized protein n=1 Tax=Podarcis muralis TaxID=64176 RepID=A0A670JUM1_PODMU